MFGAKGIKNAEDRISLVVGDIMEPFPSEVQKAGVDTLMMKHFLSAFNDKDAALILKHCVQVLAPDGKILLLQVRYLELCAAFVLCMLGRLTLSSVVVDLVDLVQAGHMQVCLERKSVKDCR